MKIINTRLKTEPLFAHAQGLVHDTKEWKAIADTKQLVNTTTLSSDITILTFVQGDKDFSLINQLDNSGVKYINAIPDNLKFWKNPAKIKYLVQAIENVKTPYVLCLDALDILCVDDLSDLLPRFEKFGCDMVYNASKLNYPNICQDDEDTDSAFKFLNAGAFIGKTSAVKDFYKHLIKTELYNEYKGFDNSEQIRVRFGRKRYSKRKSIKVDTECVIFQTLNKAQFEFDNNTLTIKK